MSHWVRFPSAVRTNAPLRVPTRTRTPLMPHTFLTFGTVFFFGPIFSPIFSMKLVHDRCDQSARRVAQRVFRLTREPAFTGGEHGADCRPSRRRRNLS